MTQTRLRSVLVVVTITAAAFGLIAIPAAGQSQSDESLPPYTAPRTADGRPALSGIWQSFTTANWDILAHPVQPGPYAELLGVWGAGRAGLSIVEGNALPYQPWAAIKQQENYDNRTVVKVANDPSRFDTGDPELQCYRAGVPRANYMPYPLQIFQTPEQILIVYEYKGAYRTIYMDSEWPAVDASWMGTSNGHWEDETLVVDVTGFNEYAWFDRAGNFHSDALHVVERWTPVSPYHLKYEATIEDPNVYTRPWTMNFMLYRHVEDNAQLIEFNCVPLVEPLMYRPLGFYDDEETDE
ncbi:MAG: hypothetical protein V3T56_09520 [Gemmatimonadales bacterium]